MHTCLFYLEGTINFNEVFYNLFNIYFSFPTVWFWLKSLDFIPVIDLIFTLQSLQFNLIRIHRVAFGVAGLETSNIFNHLSLKKKATKLYMVI